MSANLSKIFDIQKSTGRSHYGTRHRGIWGVEIETETEKKYEYPSLKYWEAKKDNSLRKFGVEYVLKAPMDGSDLDKALEEFEGCNKKFKFNDNSISTSVHVHVNMLDETYLTMVNFLTAYALVENPLIKYSGPDRLSNLFCLPIRDAEGILDKWITLLSLLNRNNFSKAAVPMEHIKYSALNVANLNTLGTLEIRSFRGENNIEAIQKWVNIIDKLRLFSKREGMTPPMILQMYKDHKSGILDLIFQEYAKDLKTKDIDTLIDKNQVLYAAKLASVSKDWSKFGILKVKPVYQEKIRGDLEAIAMDKFNRGFDELQYHERLVVIERYHLINTSVKVVDALEDI